MPKRCNLKAACAIITGIIFLALSITLFVVLLAYQGAKPDTPCAGLWGPVTYLHRGNLTYAQENTYDAVVNGSVLLSGSNPEIDVTVLKDGAVVLFHDTTMERMTGIEDTNLQDVTSAEALRDDHIILAEIDGHTYASKNYIPELVPVIEAACNADADIGINFDTKAEGAVTAGVAALVNSNCQDTSDNVIWSTPYPWVVTAIKEELDSVGLKNRIGMYMPTGEYSFLGLKFMLKTRILQSALSSGSSILVLHKTTFDKEEELIQEWRDDGWCTGIYGITPDEVASYTADYYVVDEGPVFPDLPFGGYGEDGEPSETVYDDDSLASYRWLIAVASFLLVGSLFFFWLACKCCRSSSNSVAVEDEAVAQQEAGDDDGDKSEDEEAVAVASPY